MATSKTWPGGATNVTAASYSIPAAGELNWAALRDFLIALANGAQCTTFQKFAVRQATTSPVTVATTDCVVTTKLATPGSVTVNLPAGANKQVFIIYDETGDASTNTVTINRDGSDTIEGATSTTLTTNNEVVALIYDSSATDWKIFFRSRPNPTGATLGGFTASRAIVSDGSGYLTQSAVTSTQVGYLSGASGTTGTGSIAFSSSPTFTTPAIGTPSAGVLTNCTGLPVSTGISGLGIGIASWLATPSSANLATAVTDETGSGSLVFATSPTLVTPVLGTPASGTLTNCTGLPVSTGISGFAAGIADWLATPSSANLATAMTNETGSGSLVFATSPTLVTPVLGTPTSGTLTNCTGLPISTGVSGLGTNVAAFLATPSSANLASAVTDETGSGALVFATSPTLVTPNIGTPSAGVLTNCTGLPIGGGGTGQTTATAAFDALSPGTTKGDLLVFNGTNHVRLAVGSDTNVLVADSAASEGVSWSTAGSGDVTAAANMTDNTIVRGDGGAKGIQDSGIVIDDSDNMYTVTSLAVNKSSAAAVDLEISDTLGPTLRFNTTDTTIVDADDLGKIQFYTNDASTNGTDTYAQFGAVAAGAFDGSPTNGGAFVFSTLLMGGSLTERVRIASDTMTLTQTNDYTIRFDNSDTAVVDADPLGKIEFYTNDASVAGTTGVQANVGCVADGNFDGTTTSGGAVIISTKTSAGSLTERFRVRPEGNVGVGTSSASYLLDVNGDVRADTYYYDVTSTLQSSSDERLKTNFRPLSSQLDKISQLNLYNFEWSAEKDKLASRADRKKLEGKADMGVKAQEAQEHFPELVGKDADGYLTYSYTGMIIPLVKSVQELKQEIDNLKAELKQLRNKHRGQ